MSSEPVPTGPRFEDEALADAVATCVALLSSVGARWRARLAAGHLGEHPAGEVRRLLRTIEQATALLEPGTPREPPAATDGATDDRFRRLVDAVADYAIFMLDTDGRIASWNAGAQRLKGWSAEEILGRSFEAFYTDEDLAAGKPARELLVAAQTGRYEEEGLRKRKDGTTFHAHVTLTALRDDRGVLVGYGKVTRDVTVARAAAEQLRRSEERLRILIEQVSDYAIVMLEPDGRVATWNVGAQRIKGYAAAEIIGKSFSRFYTEEDRALGRPFHLLSVAAREGVAREEAWRVRKDGTRFFGDITITALHDRTGKLYGFTKVTRDLTERKQAEHQVELYEQTRAALRQRDDFLSIASHELKTPLTSLQLQLQSLAPAIEASPKAVAKLERASRATERLSALVDTLLDVSRFASGRLRLNTEPFDLGEAVREAGERQRAEVEAAGCALTLEVGEGLEGRWDRLRVEQIVTNLLSNAAKYGGGKPVRLRALRRGALFVIEVEDEGIGVAPEDAQRIFGRFERAASVRHYGGLGLGLFVCAQIAEAHGGTIRAESEPGRGARFVVELPPGVPEPAASEAREHG